MIISIILSLNPLEMDYGSLLSGTKATIHADRMVGDSGDGDSCNMAYFFRNRELSTVMIFILHMLNQPPILPR